MNIIKIYFYVCSIVLQGTGYFGKSEVVTGAIGLSFSLWATMMLCFGKLGVSIGDMAWFLILGLIYGGIWLFLKHKKRGLKILAVYRNKIEHPLAWFSVLFLIFNLVIPVCFSHLLRLCIRWFN